MAFFFLNKKWDGFSSSSWGLESACTWMSSCEVGTPAPSPQSYEETLKECGNGMAMRLPTAGTPLKSNALSRHIHRRMLFTEFAFTLKIILKRAGVWHVSGLCLGRYGKLWMCWLTPVTFALGRKECKPLHTVGWNVHFNEITQTSRAAPADRRTNGAVE